LVSDLKFKCEQRLKLKGKTDTLLQEDFDNNKTYRAEAYSFIENLESNLYTIDDMNSEFRNAFKQWTTLIKSNTNNYNAFHELSSKASLGGNTMPYNDNAKNFSYEEINKKTVLVRKDSIDSGHYFSDENTYNIQITLFHAFFYMVAYSIVFPTNILLVKDIHYDPSYTGLSMACTPFGSLFSIFITNIWISKSFKKPMIVSVLMIMIGSVSYILAFSCESMTLLCLGRFILGLGGIRLVNRNYILLFIPKKKVSKYLLYFQIISLFGLACGPFFNILVNVLTSFFAESLYFNTYLNPVWIILILSVILFINVICFYTEPIQSGFTICKDNLTSEIQSIHTISRDTISKQEKLMIDNIDARLGQINEKNKFSDTNLVAKNIEQIAWKENKTTSYLYKCFIVFISLLIVIRVNIFY
jgi:MFS family permease